MRATLVFLFVFVLQSNIVDLRAAEDAVEDFTSEKAVTDPKPDLKLKEAETWGLMIGKWYGSQPTKEGGARSHIVERFPNGTYRITFRLYDPQGGYREQREVGHWGVSGPIYFTILRGWLEGDKMAPADPGDPYYQDAYKIITLNDEVFEYEHAASGNRFSIRRVPQDFEFPKMQL